MLQAVQYEPLLYADDSCLLFQHNDIKEIKINKNLCLVCDRFIDNKLKVHFGEDKLNHFF